MTTDECKYAAWRRTWDNHQVPTVERTRELRQAILDCSHENRLRRQGDRPGAPFCDDCDEAVKTVNLGGAVSSHLPVFERVMFLTEGQ